jgi:hypothetical protein
MVVVVVVGLVRSGCGGCGGDSRVRSEDQACARVRCLGGGGSGGDGGGDGGGARSL